MPNKNKKQVNTRKKSKNKKEKELAQRKKQEEQNLKLDETSWQIIRIIIETLNLESECASACRLTSIDDIKLNHPENIIYAGKYANDYIVALNNQITRIKADNAALIFEKLNSCIVRINTFAQNHSGKIEIYENVWLMLNDIVATEQRIMYTKLSSASTYIDNTHRLGTFLLDKYTTPQYAILQQLKYDDIKTRISLLTLLSEITLRTQKYDLTKRYLQQLAKHLEEGKRLLNGDAKGYLLDHVEAYLFIKIELCNLTAKSQPDQAIVKNRMRYHFLQVYHNAKQGFLLKRQPSENLFINFNVYIDRLLKEPDYKEAYFFAKIYLKLIQENISNYGTTKIFSQGTHLPLEKLQQKQKFALDALRKAAKQIWLDGIRAHKEEYNNDLYFSIVTKDDEDRYIIVAPENPQLFASLLEKNNISYHQDNDTFSLEFTPQIWIPLKKSADLYVKGITEAQKSIDQTVECPNPHQYENDDSKNPIIATISDQKGEIKLLNPDIDNEKITEKANDEKKETVDAAALGFFAYPKPKRKIHAKLEKLNHSQIEVDATKLPSYRITFNTPVDFGNNFIFNPKKINKDIFELNASFANCFVRMDHKLAGYLQRNYNLVYLDVLRTLDVGFVLGDGRSTKGGKGSIIINDKIYDKQQDAKIAIKIKNCSGPERAFGVLTDKVKDPIRGWCLLFTLNAFDPTHNDPPKPEFIVPVKNNVV